MRLAHPGRKIFRDGFCRDKGSLHLFHLVLERQDQRMKKGRMWILRIDAADGENVWFGVKMLAPIDDNASPGKARRYETRRQFDGPVIMRQRLLRLALEAGNFTLGKPGVGGSACLASKA